MESRGLTVCMLLLVEFRCESRWIHFRSTEEITAFNRLYRTRWTVHMYRRAGSTRVELGGREGGRESDVIIE